MAWLADEDLFRYAWAGAMLVGFGVLIFYAISGWIFLEWTRDDDQVNYQSPTIRDNIKRLR